jgi:hypothetical protein
LAAETKMNAPNHALLRTGLRPVDELYRSTNRMKRWKSALETVAGSILSTKISWMVVGSVASVLRGCRFEPNDLDILLPDLASLRLLGDKMDAFIRKDTGTEIQTEEFPDGFKWHKLLWHKDDFRIDASFIESGGGILDSENGYRAWEGGVFAWKYIEMIEFEAHTIPVPNLCVQLESQLRRGRLDRAEEIKRVLNARGYSRNTAKICLSSQNFNYLVS